MANVQSFAADLLNVSPKEASKVSTTIRFAQFNASLNRNTEGQLITDLSTPDNAQAQAVAEIIQRTNPDVLLINEFDYDASGTAAQLFQQNYLGISQNGVDPVEYPYFYVAPSNTGVPSGFDFDNNGTVGGGNDAFGFGLFPGQFGMVVYSKYPIDFANVRTFQNFLWKDMPGALLPDDPNTPEANDWYSPEELEVFRLSSKSHWDLPILVNGETIHVLVSHPTPPVFDGAEDRNGTRNHDEIRFWADYVTPGQGDYIYDDAGTFGGLESGAQFVIMGDQNADPFDGDSTQDAILQLLDNSLINTSVTPSSEGGPDASDRQGLNNLTHAGDPSYDTADFAEENFGGPGNVRADYVLPSNNLQIVNSAVFWPTNEDPLFSLVGDFPFPTSDHRLVWVDVTVPTRNTVTGVEVLGEVDFPTGFEFDGTEVGGLSGITYDAENGVYYSISDDRSQIDPARFYTLSIDLSDGSLDDGDVTFDSVTTLLDEAGNPFTAFSLDPEGIALSANGTVYISSEGDANALINPFVNEFSLSGNQLSSLPIPDKFLPTLEELGIRNNLAFESLTISPDGRYLYTATENALKQDGAAAGVDQESLSRIIKYDLVTGEVVGEFVYVTEPVADAPIPDGSFSTNGLVDLLAIDNNGTLLALERSFSTGVGNTVKLYEIRTQGALDVSGLDDLFDEENGAPFEIDPAVSKRELLDFADLGITPDNLEGIALGPKLADGRQTLIVVSDNNFSSTQKTQVIALALDLEGIPVVLPKAETPQVIDTDETVPAGTIPGDADDPAIWVHPTDAAQSLVISSLKDGGLAVFDLNGQLVQSILPAEYGEIRYNNVDILYGFKLDGETVDLAIASDRENDTLAVYQIDPTTRQLSDVTSDAIPASIFGIDDGEQTAYGLTTYKSPISGKNYVFVSQREGDQIAQLEIVEDGNGKVTAVPVRTLTVPIPDGGELEDAQVEGMVADRELGYLYVGQENVGFWKFSAEPSGGDEGVLIDSIDGDNLEADVEGLTIYYGANGTGYLLVSSQGDNTFAVYRREGNNEYIGNFTIGAAGSIDSVEESDGADVINVPLGSQYPFGLLVVQDGANDPQVLAEDDGELENISTGFKYVSWLDVANAFPEALQVDPTSANPRQPVPSTLPNGVASGDTTQTSTVLWTRSTVLGEVTFEYSTDPDFGAIAGTATATVTDPDIPVKVLVDGLTPGTQYYYRVTDAAQVKLGGQFRTADASGTLNGLRFGAAGDWQQAPPFPSLKNIAERNLDFLVKLGDTIYGDLETPALPGVTQARTLDDFRTKHAEILSTRFGVNFMSEVYASTTILSTIDDHEIVDNFAGGARPGESPDAPDIGSSPDPLFTDAVDFVNDTQVYEDALQAYQEYHPIRDQFYDETGDDRTAGERQLYRANTYGNNAAMFVLDTRSFRDAQIDPVDLSNPIPFLTETFNPDRTLLGDAQLNQLKADLLQAETDGITWKFITVPEPIQNFGPVNAEDRFEGYAAERTELLKFVDDNNISNVVFLAGDFHGTIVNNITYQLGPGQAQIDSGAFEVVTGPAAFFDGLFGPAVVNLALGAGLLSPQEKAFYDLLPVAGDTDSIVNDKDDFVKQLLNAQINAFGYDPVGLNDNLSGINGVDATLLQGDYVSTHTYGWTEFEIDPETQALTVTTYGIDAYSEADLLADPEAIANLTPEIVSQFVVNPTNFTSGTNGDDTLIGTPGPDRISSLGGDDTIAGELGNDVLFGGNGDDVLRGDANRVRHDGRVGGDDIIYGGNGDDRIGGKGGDDQLYGDAGKDIIWGDRGNDLLRGGLGDDLLIGGAGQDTFVLAIGEGKDTIRDFNVRQDVIGLAGDLSFDQLSISKVRNNTVISMGDETLAVLQGVSSSLTIANFVAIA
jgi:3-phytase/alkaline phosphatase D